MATKQDLRTTDTRERVLGEALRVYLEAGYSQMGLDRIAKNLGVTRPAIYYHFPGGKEQLFGEMVEAANREKAAEFDEAIGAGRDSKERLRNILRSFVGEPMLDDSGLTRTELGRLEGDTVSVFGRSCEPLVGRVRGVIREGVARGELAPGDPDALFSSFQALCRHVGRPGSGDSDDGQARAFADRMMDVWLRGAATEGRGREG